MKKEYASLEIECWLLEKKDLITASAGSDDSQKDNDLTSDDMFN